MGDWYRTRYGVFNHFDTVENVNKRPLASDVLFPCFDISSIPDSLEKFVPIEFNISLFQSNQSLMKVYLKFDIKELYGINVFEFMSASVTEITDMLKIATDIINKKPKIQDPPKNK